MAPMLTCTKAELYLLHSTLIRMKATVGSGSIFNVSLIVTDKSKSAEGTINWALFVLNCFYAGSFFAVLKQNRVVLDSYSPLLDCVLLIFEIHPYISINLLE